MKVALIFWMLLAPMNLFAQQTAEASKLELSLAELKHPLKPMLWSVTKEGLKGEAYLFGTIHVADSRVTTLHPLAEKAFIEAHRIYTEVDLSGRRSPEMKRLSERSKKSSLVQSLGPKLVAKIDRELAHYDPTLKVKSFDRMKTWAFAVRLPQLTSSLRHAEKVLDIQLWQRAEQSQRSVLALETFTEQMKRVNSLSEMEQRSLVIHAVESLKRKRLKPEKESDGMLEIYLRGDTRALTRRVTPTQKQVKAISQQQTKVAKAVLFDRNQRIAEKISIDLVRHPQKNHFFAIGAAHYVGQHSVIRKLKKLGYTIKCVKSQPSIK